MSSQARFVMALVCAVLITASLTVPASQGQERIGIVVQGASLDLITSVPRTMTYQGILKDGDGNPIPNESKDIIFRIYDDATAGELEWDETIQITTDDGGYFTATLINLEIPFDEDYWLELEIDSEILDPRQKMSMVGYAAVSDTADYARRVSTIDGATGGTISGDVNIQSDLSVAGNINATGKATIGPGHTNAGVYAFIAGQNNATGGNYSTVGGGYDNAAITDGSTVGGGVSDTASGTFSTVGGGALNVASGQHSTVAGGNVNLANGLFSTVSGGANDTASGDRSCIGGGAYNIASGDNATVGGGFLNRARGLYSVVSGGGGPIPADSNAAIGDWSAVSGGKANAASGEYSTIAGGRNNISSNDGSTIGGGNTCIASNQYSVVAGGNTNTASGGFSAVGGGVVNEAGGLYSCVPGGQGNTASGDHSFAAGRQAQAIHNGTFVWADQTNVPFISTDEDQFLIRASGGVGIGTTSPDFRLEVEGTVGIDNGSYFNDVPFTIKVPSNQLGLISRIAKGGSIINVVDNNGNVGIGTFTPEGALDVSSTTGALIVPRMSVAQRDALTPVNGMIIYNKTTNQFNFYENDAWVTK